MEISRYNRIIALILTVILCMSLTACSSSTAVSDESKSVSDEEITNGIVSCFMPLTEIPRQSHHEENISKYLMNWAKEHGFNPTSDDQMNVIFDVPATSGMENAPMTILQGHMDMVIAVEEGKNFDPQKDPITVINDGKALTADGTSLGADDGIGVATALYIIENNKSHGPLRVVFTTNEEDGMSGAFGLSKDVANGAKYVLNLDYENSAELVNSAAAGVVNSYKFKPETASPSRNQAYVLTVGGLLSGHSGIDINKGRLNAIKATGMILDDLTKAMTDYELAYIKGGSANNAIPAKCEACIVINADKESLVRERLESCEKVLTEKYGDVETGLKISIEKCDMPKNVFAPNSQSSVVYFVNNVFDGVYSMSAYVDGLVESSSNLGLISFSADSNETCTASACIRSSDETKLGEIVEGHTKLASECNIETVSKRTSDPWPVNPDSNLVKLVQTAYKEVTGDDIKVTPIHAGLECGTFSSLNSDLDIVSIGFDIHDPHTVNETCVLTTIPAVYRTIAKVLVSIGTEKS